MKIISELKRNWFFILFLLVFLVGIVQMNLQLEAPVVSHPDTQISFSADEMMLEQDWQPHIKKISRISIPYIAENSFQSDLNLALIADDGWILSESAARYEFEANTSGVLDFSLGTVKVEPGVRYKIQLQFKNPSEKGVLLLDAGSNYMGCRIDGTDCGRAAAFTVSFVKSSRISWFIFTFFPFISFALLIMIIWNRKFEETIGLAIIAVVFILYIMGLAGFLETGIFLVYLLAAISLLSSIYLYNRKKMTFRQIFSPGILIYGILIILIIMNCKDSFLARWDEYSHWGLAAKDMFYYNSFGKHIGTTVMLPRYLPFSTLAEYLFIYTNGLFSQSLLYVGYQSVMAGILIISCKAAVQKRKFLFPVLTGIICLPVIFYIDVFNSLYVDPLLAALLAYVLICYFSEKMSVFNLIRIIGGLIALTLTKDVGVVLAGLMTLIMLADVLQVQYKQKKFEIKQVLLPCVCTLLVCGMFLSWQVYMSIPVVQIAESSQVTNLSDEETSTASEEESVTFSSSVSASGITMNGILELFKGKAPEYKYQVIKKYIMTLFDEDTYFLGNIAVSYMDLSILLLIVAWLVSYMTVWEDKEKRMFTFGVLTFIAGILYCGFLLVTYLFSFAENEALRLSSHNRYWASFLCGVLIAFYSMLMIRAAELKQPDNQKKAWYGVMLFCSIVLIAVPVSGFVIKNMDTEITKEEIYGYDDMAEAFRSFAERGETVYFVCNNSSGYAYYMFRNAISPLLAPYVQCNIFASRDLWQEQMNYYAENNIEPTGGETILSADEWCAQLKNCEYVFLFHPNEVFSKSYGELFEEPETIADGTFYQVINTEKGVILQYIGSVGVKSFK